MARIEVFLDGKLEDGRETVEGTDDSIKIRDHGVEVFEEGTLRVIPWHRVREVIRTSTPLQT
ncbi:MAG: hypothetical protein ACRDHJ_02395 [Actinomycetota bacterium]|jgi:hypothetical protein